MAPSKAEFVSSWFIIRKDLLKFKTLKHLFVVMPLCRAHIRSTRIIHYAAAWSTLDLILNRRRRRFGASFVVLRRSPRCGQLSFFPLRRSPLFCAGYFGYISEAGEAVESKENKLFSE